MRNRIFICWIISASLSVCFAASSGNGEMPFAVKKIESAVSGGVYVRRDSPCDSTYNASSSVKVAMRAMDVKAAWRIPSVKFGSECDYDEFSWGAQFRFGEICGVPANLLFGKLNFSGSISKMNAPYISTSASCFGAVPSAASGITVSLPGISSSSKPVSAAFSYKMTPKKNIRKFDLCFFSDDRGNFAQSICVNLKAGRKTQFSFSQTGGSFSVSNETAQWFSKTPLFPETKIWFADVQCGINSPFYTAKWCADFYSPGSRDFEWSVSCENELSAGWCGVLFSGFAASSTEIFTPSSKNVKILSQIKINPVVTVFPFQAFRMRLGGVFYREEKLTSERDVETNCKGGAGLHITGRYGSSRLTFTGAEKEYTVYSYCSFRAQWKPAFSVSYAVTGQEDGTAEKKEVKAWFSASVPVKNCGTAALFSAKASGSAVFEDGFSYGTAALSAGIKQSSKKAMYSYSVNIKYKF